MDSPYLARRRENRLAEAKIFGAAWELKLYFTIRAMTKAQKLATIKHGLTCQYNHTDGCGWYYDKDWKHDRLSALRDAESEVWIFSDQEIDSMLNEFEEFSDRKQKIEDDKNAMRKKLGLRYWETVGNVTKFINGKL